MRCDGLPLERPRTEAPVAHGFDRLFVEAHSEALAHLDVVNTSVFADYHHQLNDSLEFCLSGLVRKTGLGTVDHLRHGHAVATRNMNSGWPFAGVWPNVVPHSVTTSGIADPA